MIDLRELHQTQTEAYIKEVTVRSENRAGPVTGHVILNSSATLLALYIAISGVKRYIIYAIWEPRSENT